MGAKNVQRAAETWRRQLKANSWCCLNWMALKARDDDAEPWFGQGHAALAVWALGLELPTRNSDVNRALYDMQMRRVRRAITPLIQLGAVETRERATYGLLGTSHVIYRLYLWGPHQSRPYPDVQLPDTPLGLQPVTGTGGGVYRPPGA